VTRHDWIPVEGADAVDGALTWINPHAVASMSLSVGSDLREVARLELVTGSWYELREPETIKLLKRLVMGPVLMPSGDVLPPGAKVTLAG